MDEFVINHVTVDCNMCLLFSHVVFAKQFQKKTENDTAATATRTVLLSAVAVSPRGCRYDNQIAVIGHSLQQQLQKYVRVCCWCW